MHLRPIKNILLSLVILLTALSTPACAELKDKPSNNSLPESIPNNVNFVPLPAVKLETDIVNLASHYWVDHIGSNSILAKRVSKEAIDTHEYIEKPRIEKLALPSFTPQGNTKPMERDKVHVSKIFDEGIIIASDNELKIYDSKLMLQDTVVYPKEVYTSGSTPDIGISPDGKFTLINGSLWNLSTGQWIHGLKSPSTVSKITMGKSAAIINDYWTNETWVINYKTPRDIKTFKTKRVDSVMISPDGKLIFIQMDSLFPKSQLIDVQSGKVLSSWRGNQGVSINWTYNRLIRDGKTYQLYPKKLIAENSIETNCTAGEYFSSGIYFFEQHPLGVCIDKREGSEEVTVFNALDGSTIIRDELVSANGEKLKFLPEHYNLIYSENPFTLLLDAGNGKIQPYQLQITN